MSCFVNVSLGFFESRPITIERFLNLLTMNVVFFLPAFDESVRRNHEDYECGQQE